MKLKLDTVEGHHLHESVHNGRIVRTGLLEAESWEIPQGKIPTAGMLAYARNHVAIPKLGAPYPWRGYDKFFLRSVDLRALNVRQYTLLMTYEFDGQIVIQDDSTLQMMPTERHLTTGEPLIIKYTSPHASAPVERLLRQNVAMPLRTFSVQITTPYALSADLLNALGGVNEFPWQGLPRGYWMMSGLKGSTLDGGITFKSALSFTTKQRMDWSSYGFIREPSGQAVAVDPADIASLISEGYIHGKNDSVNGVLKVGHYPMFDFFNILGF